METFTIERLTFSYPSHGNNLPAVKDLSLSVKQGEFLVLCGKSGCGKSTLLRHLKTVLTPHGSRRGEVFFEGKPLETVDRRTQASKIGYVMQSPDNQIVTDKVWHELAFGLESLGMDTRTIRLRVAEMASFFGIQTWFHKSVNELSGGQKQLLNLAAIMAMQPSVLILDEPTSQLDPIAASDFLQTIGRINRELGTTIILSEHRLEEVLPFCDTLAVMDRGQIIAKGCPKNVGAVLKKAGHGMFFAMPAAMQIYAGVENDLECPLTVREGREWLNDIGKTREIRQPEIGMNNSLERETVLELKEIWFKYEKNAPDVIKGLTMSVSKGEFFAIVGGNGTGKTTALSLITGLCKPYRGKILVNGINIGEIPGSKKCAGLIAALPQNPQTIFVGKTVESDLHEAFAGKKLPEQNRRKKVYEIACLCQIEDLLGRHPYDLSGGEQQRAALAKVLLLEPEILLLDEPTKGLDAYFKLTLAEILKSLQSEGVTVIMVSHDVEFCASYADRCAMFFDGNISAEESSRQFFTGNSFYTTSANRIARHILPQAVTAEDVVRACGGTGVEGSNRKGTSETPGITPPYPETFPEVSSVQAAPASKKVSERTLAAALIILIIIPLTIWFGFYFLNDRKYYVVSMLVIMETMIPFAMVFKNRKPQARELVILSVICAIAVAGRAAFFMIPQFKPVIAIIIIAGVCFGGESGFLVGAVSGFVSNFFAGQGPWTPWQMFSFGIIGFLAGVLFKKGILRRNRAALCIFGGLATFFIYGGIMNPASVLTSPVNPTKELLMLAYLRGIPMDLIHAAATVVFLAVTAKPMLEKLDRIIVKYGLAEDR